MRYCIEKFDQHGTIRSRTQFESPNLGRHLTGLARLLLGTATLLLSSCNGNLPFPYS